MAAPSKAWHNSLDELVRAPMSSIRKNPRRAFESRDLVFDRALDTTHAVLDRKATATGEDSLQAMFDGLILLCDNVDDAALVESTERMVDTLLDLNVRC